MSAKPLTPEREQVLRAMGYDEWMATSSGDAVILMREVWATLEAARAERDRWKQTAEEECWPFEWEVASQLKAERDAARARCAEVENVNLGLLRNIAALTAERDTLREQLAMARRTPGADDPRVAAINDAVQDFIVRRTEPRLVCYHVPLLRCEVLMFAVGEGLPKAISYAQFIKALERSGTVDKAEAAIAACRKVVGP